MNAKERSEVEKVAYYNWRIRELKRKGVIVSVITGPATAIAAWLAYVLITNGHYVLGGLAVAVAVILGLTFHVQFAEARRPYV